MLLCMTCSKSWTPNHLIATSYYNSSSVYLFVCSLSPPRSFDGSSPNLVAVCRWTSHLPLRGSFSKRSTGRRVNGSLSLSTILYMSQPHATQLQNAPFALLLLQQSLIRHLLLHCISTVYVGGPRNCPWGVLFLKGQRVDGSTGQQVKRVHGSHLDGVCRWTSQLPLKGSFSKRSTGRRVTFTFTILYMIADDARLTPPRCKKHTAYDDTTLTPHHCKKHTASFARSMGKFPSYSKSCKWIMMKFYGGVRGGKMNVT